MPVIIPLLPRRRRRRSAVGAVPTPPVPANPVLLSASYVAGASVTLVFDRAITLVGLRPDFILVNDPVDTGFLWEGGGATLLGPATLEVELGEIGGASGVATRLNAPNNTGIRSAADDLPWNGVTDYPV